MRTTIDSILESPEFAAMSAWNAAAVEAIRFDVEKGATDFLLTTQDVGPLFSALLVLSHGAEGASASYGFRGRNEGTFDFLIEMHGAPAFFVASTLCDDGRRLLFVYDHRARKEFTSLTTGLDLIDTARTALAA